MSSTITVRVGRVGAKIETVALSQGATVQDALTAAGITMKETEQIELRGDTVNSTTSLQDDDLILVVKNVVGGR
jgi:sulfur carrier protein ThiS